jgi:hypothetical protein
MVGSMAIQPTMTPEEEAEWVRTMTGCPPHHWFLGTPVAGTVKGICAKCGAQREFSNLYDNDEHNGPHAIRVRSGRRGARAAKAVRSSQQM